MKQIAVALCAPVCFFLCATFAAADMQEIGYEKIKGKIVSVDQSACKLVIVDSSTGKQRTIMIDSKLLPHLRAGATIEALFDRKKNSAQGLKIISPH